MTNKTIEGRRTERPTAEAIRAAACPAIVRRGVEATRIADMLDRLTRHV